MLGEANHFIYPVPCERECEDERTGTSRRHPCRGALCGRQPAHVQRLSASPGKTRMKILASGGPRHARRLQEMVRGKVHCISDIYGGRRSAAPALFRGPGHGTSSRSGSDGDVARSLPKVPKLLAIDLFHVLRFGTSGLRPMSAEVTAGRAKDPTNFFPLMNLTLPLIFGFTCRSLRVAPGCPCRCDPLRPSLYQQRLSSRPALGNGR